MSSGLTHRVDADEQAEMRRLEGFGEACETACAAAAPSLSTCCSGSVAANTAAAANEEVGTQQSEAGAQEQLVTGYAEYRATLAGRKNYRKAEDIDLRLPQASTVGAVPRMRHYPRTEEGRRDWKEAFNKHAGGFAHSHVSARTVKGRMGQVGLFGDYCEQEGHGEFVRWQRQTRGTLKQIVVPVIDDDSGQIKVPAPETIGEYVMVMATGDTEARPKGGTAEYRTDWHHARERAHFKLKPREHGRGAYADKPFLFVSIEKTKEAISQFYDQHLKVREHITERNGMVRRC